MTTGIVNRLENEKRETRHAAARELVKALEAEPNRIWFSHSKQVTIDYCTTITTDMTHREKESYGYGKGECKN